MANVKWIQEFIDDPTTLERLEIKDLFAAFEELELYYAEQEAECYRAGLKERHPDTKIAVARKNYWRRKHQGLREATNNETARIQKGLM